MIDTNKPFSFSHLVERVRRTEEEHQARLEADPEYRAAHEAREAARLAEEARQARWAQEEAARRIHERRLRKGLPERVIRLLGAPAVTEATRIVEEFMAGQRSMLVLLGGEGCGKTVAACLALDRARDGRLVKAGAIARAGAFDSELFAELAEAEVLVVDDLGVEPLDDKGWALSTFAQLFDGRYDSCRKTILTSNLTPEDFTGRYFKDGGRLRGRFREAGLIVTVGGKSLRGAAQ